MDRPAVSPVIPATVWMVIVLRDVSVIPTMLRFIRQETNVLVSTCIVINRIGINSVYVGLYLDDILILFIIFSCVVSAWYISYISVPNNFLLFADFNTIKMVGLDGDDRSVYTVVQGSRYFSNFVGVVYKDGTVYYSEENRWAMQIVQISIKVNNACFQ